jgi:hypothetical protein
LLLSSTSAAVVADADVADVGNAENAPMPYQALNTCRLTPRSLSGRPMSRSAPSRGDTETRRKPTLTAW